MSKTTKTAKRANKAEQAALDNVVAQPVTAPVESPTPSPTLYAKFPNLLMIPGLMDGFSMFGEKNVRKLFKAIDKYSTIPVDVKKQNLHVTTAETVTMRYRMLTENPKERTYFMATIAVETMMVSDPEFLKTDAVAVITVIGRVSKKGNVKLATWTISPGSGEDDYDRAYMELNRQYGFMEPTI